MSDSSLTIWKTLKQFGKTLKRELALYQRVLKDSRTPRRAKIFLGLAIGYLLLPFDLIPDFIPVLGQLDDILIVPGLFYLALRLIPRDLIEEHRREIN
jgi:uncharacterized membrane protein YkvA (DUF1232 family)